MCVVVVRGLEVLLVEFEAGFGEVNVGDVEDCIGAWVIVSVEYRGGE